MCLWIYCCWKAAHIWWITLVSSMRFSCSGCARTLHCNRSNKWSIVFKSRFFAGHLLFWTLFATNITDSLLVCFYPPDIMRNPMPTSYRDWHGYEEKEPTEWRHFDTSSQLCFREWLHWSFRMHKYAWARSIKLIFAIFNVFHNRQSTRNTFLSNSTTTLPCTRSPSS